jgi:hypothetical protein
MESPSQRNVDASSARGSKAPFRDSSPSHKQQCSGAAEPVCVLGVGAGGIVELAQRVNDRMVSWALLRFQVGGGTFLRTKHVAIHCNGDDTPVMLRGWLNARSSEVLSLIGEVHAHIDIKHAKDLTVENVCRRLLPLFAADNMVLSLAKLNEEYGKVLEQMQKEACERQIPLSPPVVQEARTPSIPNDVTDALKAVGAERGPCNWVLFEPRSSQLHNAGLGGLEELKSHLLEDRVLFGALRLTFGCSNRDGMRGPPGITKHIFVHWVGSRVGIVQRGLLNARLASAATFVGKYCAVAFRREAHCLGDLKLEDIIAELRRLTVVDGVAATGGIAASRISAAEYLAALREEAEEVSQSLSRSHSLSQTQPESEAEPERPKPDHTTVDLKALDVKSAIGKVRSLDGEWNWVLCGWERPEPRKLPPSPSHGGA